jgi:hypothetical protein
MVLFLSFKTALGHVEVQPSLTLIVQKGCIWYADQECLDAFSWVHVYADALSPSLSVNILEKPAESAAHNKGSPVERSVCIRVVDRQDSGVGAELDTPRRSGY